MTEVLSMLMHFDRHIIDFTKSMKKTGCLVFNYLIDIEEKEKA